jgi:hypothetical protein
VNSPNDFGQITGIFFDLGIDIVESDITGESAAGVLQGHNAFATNAAKIKGVTNLNLGDFDVVLGYKVGNNRAEVPLQFFVNDHGQTLEDWVRVGVRFQSVGENAFGGGSDKEASTDASVVPIPATAWLFGTAILGVFSVTRRQKNSA